MPKRRIDKNTGPYLNARERGETVQEELREDCKKSDPSKPIRKRDETKNLSKRFRRITTPRQSRASTARSKDSWLKIPDWRYASACIEGMSSRRGKGIKRYN
jgi:hypothetical protein